MSVINSVICHGCQRSFRCIIYEGLRADRGRGIESGVRIPPHPPVRRLSDNKIPLLCRPPMKTNNVDSMNQKGYQNSMGGTLLQPRKKSPVTLQQARNQFRKHNPAHPKSLDKFWPSKEQMESRGRIWQVWVNQTLKHPST